LLLCHLGQSKQAHAETEGVIHGARIELGEVLTSAPETMAQIDLGKAPLPGQRRTFTREQLSRHIKLSGFDAAALDLPKVVTARVPGEKLSPAELAERLRPSVENALPDGVSLTQLTTPHSVVVSSDTQIGTIDLPKLPKRVGALRLTLTADLQIHGVPYRRVSMIA